MAERAQLIPDGCLADGQLVCDVCGAAIEPGDAVHCNDGYDRIYGEFVLAHPDGLHEDNMPSCHKRCSCPAPNPHRATARTFPRAVVVGPRAELVGLARARLFGLAVVGAVLAVAGGVAVWVGAGAGIGVAAAGVGLAIAASGIATRLRADVAGCNAPRRALCAKPAESVAHPNRRASC